MASRPCPSQPSLAEDLERFVREQAALYGEVISYVPAMSSKTKAAPETSASETEEVASSLTGLELLQQKVSVYRDEPWTQAENLEQFHDLIKNCQKCPLGQTRKNLVFGTGNPNAKALFIGEAPGADEDETGFPFVGRAGQLLTKMLAAIELSREEVFIANILKDRPPLNRDPKPEKVEACEPYLWKQILMIQPKLIMCLGRIAGANLLKRQEPLAKMRGQVHELYGIKVLVTYHPAALLRNPGWKAGAWEDLKKFRAMYDEA